jgi:hypothetical protein
MKINVVIEVPENWEQRLDMQPWVEKEIKEDRWSWNYPKPDLEQTALYRLARQTLHLAFVWNDHNFNHPRDAAVSLCNDLGIKSFTDANNWLESLPKVEAKKPVENPSEWRVSVTACGQVTLIESCFEHDECLRLTGDYGSYEEKIKRAELLCEKLNKGG